MVNRLWDTPSLLVNTIEVIDLEGLLTILNTEFHTKFRGCTILDFSPG